MSQSGKFLVDFVNKLGNKSLFFSAWFVIVVGFAILMLNFRRSSDKRNFRDKPYRGHLKHPDKKAPSSSVPAVREEDSDEDVVKIRPK